MGSRLVLCRTKTLSCGNRDVRDLREGIFFLNLQTGDETGFGGCWRRDRVRWRCNPVMCRGLVILAGRRIHAPMEEPERWLKCRGIFWWRVPWWVLFGFFGCSGSAGLQRVGQEVIGRGEEK